MIDQVFTERAKALGFIAIGFSRPRTPLYFDAFVRWIREHEMGDLAYLRRNIDLRREPERLLAGLKTIISLAYPYPAHKPSTPDGYSVSRYSTPHEEDYHIRLRRLGKQLCGFIQEIFPESRSRVCVDSAPILERSFAVASGVGFFGKNNLVIVPGYGSYCFLAEILTTAEFPIPPLAQVEHKCGACTECIHRCPTGALEEPFHLDVTKCLSYLTIEARGDIGQEIFEKMGTTFFGCDVCQEVCPFNKNAFPIVSLPCTDALLEINEGDFERIFGKSALARTGLKKLKRNLAQLRRLSTTRLGTQT
jgi:epoxyqueuosine reductase